MTKTKRLPKAWSAEGWTERRDLIAKLPLRVRALLAAEWAADLLPLWVAELSPDYRPAAAAIESSLQWVADPSEQKRKAAAAAYAAPAAAAANADADAAANAANAAYAAHAAAAAAAAADAAVAAHAAYAVNAVYAAAAAAADAAYAAANAVYAAAYAAHAAVYAADAARSGKWKWLCWTFRRCKGPQYAFAAEWRTTEAVALAEGMWSRRRADCLPILADALEEAGLTDQAVLRPMREENDTACLSEWAIWNLMEFDK